VKYLSVILLLVACKVKGEAPKAPPIADGKCLVDKYVGTTELTQVCNFAGYSWSCQYNGITREDECTRGAEVAGERLPAVIK
jgi:hypothetical protein